MSKAYVILVGDGPEHRINVAWLGVTCNRDAPHEGIFDRISYEGSIVALVCPAKAERDSTGHLTQLRVQMPDGSWKKTPIYYDDPPGSWETRFQEAKDALKKHVRAEYKRSRMKDIP